MFLIGLYLYSKPLLYQPAEGALIASLCSGSSPKQSAVEVEKHILNSQTFFSLCKLHLWSTMDCFTLCNMKSMSELNLVRNSHNAERDKARLRPLPLKLLPSLCLAWQAAAVLVAQTIEQSLQDKALAAALRNKVTVLQTVFSAYSPSDCEFCLPAQGEWGGVQGCLWRIQGTAWHFGKWAYLL